MKKSDLLFFISFAGVLLVSARLGFLIWNHHEIEATVESKPAPIQEAAAEVKSPVQTPPEPLRQSKTTRREMNAPVSETEKVAPPSKAPANLANKKAKGLFDGAELISSDESSPDAEGYFSKWRVYRTHFHDPLLLVKEDWRKDSSGNQPDTLISRSTMVSSQVLIQLQSGAATADLSSLLSKNKAYLEPMDADSGTYYVKFDGSDPHGVDNVLSDISKSSSVQTADPDYVASGI